MSTSYIDFIKFRYIIEGFHFDMDKKCISENNIRQMT